MYDNLENSSSARVMLETSNVELLDQEVKTTLIYAVLEISLFIQIFSICPTMICSSCDQVNPHEQHNLL